MEYFITAVIAFIVLVAAFVWWRYTSVARGARQRDAKVFSFIDQIGEKLAVGQQPTLEEVELAASNSFVRPILYGTLEYFERLDLFPKHLTTPEAQAEAQLTYWMMHPNELQDTPNKIELVEKVIRELDGQKCDYYVFR